MKVLPTVPHLDKNREQVAAPTSQRKNNFKKKIKIHTFLNSNQITFKVSFIPGYWKLNHPTAKVRTRQPSRRGPLRGAVRSGGWSRNPPLDPTPHIRTWIHTFGGVPFHRLLDGDGGANPATCPRPSTRCRRDKPTVEMCEKWSSANFHSNYQHALSNTQTHTHTGGCVAPFFCTSSCFTSLNDNAARLIYSFNIAPDYITAYAKWIGNTSWMSFT